MTALFTIDTSAIQNSNLSLDIKAELIRIAEVLNAAVDVTADEAHLALLSTATAGAVVASKAAVYDSAGKVFMSSATPAAAGNAVGNGTALTAQFNAVTGADGTKGVVLPVAAADEIVAVVNTDATNALKVYAVTGSQINALGSTVAYSVTPGQVAIFVGRSSTLWYTAAATDTVTGLTASAAELNYNDIAVLGTGAASKAVVLDTGEDYTWPATGVLTYGVMKDPAGTTLGATAAEINAAADVSAFTQTLTVSGAVTAGKRDVFLNHASVTIAATIADASAHAGVFKIESTLEPGVGGDHTCTITTGTWNGTNKIATFADALDSLVVHFDASGNGIILVNTGSVGLSG